MANQYANLGSPVSSRTTSWLDLCTRAWGSEFQAPDHNVYKWSNGRGFDSTDRGLTGVYGVVGDDVILIDGSQYPDMRDGLFQQFTGGPDGSQNNGFGTFNEITRNE